MPAPGRDAGYEQGAAWEPVADWRTILCSCQRGNLAQSRQLCRIHGRMREHRKSGLRSNADGEHRAWERWGAPDYNQEAARKSTQAQRPKSTRAQICF